MTYREKREKRAEQRRDWAASREAKSEAGFAKAKEIADMIPFGQPILVGHHSEGRARKDQERITKGMAAGHENAKVAERHEQAADEIERQLGTSIYDDDPDAKERLEEKIADLEAKRDEMKARNAAYRKEHREELKAMGPYERSQSVPYPTYSLSNLSGNISRLKKRLAALSREERPRQIVARFASSCDECGEEIQEGETILWYRRSKRAVHAAHGEEAKMTQEFPHPSRVTTSEDEFQVTGLLPKCPECPLVEGHEGDHFPLSAEELGPEGVAIAREIDRVADLYRIVESKTAGEVEGQTIDLFTASALIQVWEGLNEKNKEKFGLLPLGALIDFAMERSRA